MHVVATGHLGCIRIICVPILLRASHGVIGFDRHPRQRPTFESGGKIAEVSFIQKDMREGRVSSS
jgi:hypothetical protein